MSDAETRLEGERLAYFRMSVELLTALLELPSTVKVRRVRGPMAGQRQDEFDIVLEGPGLPEFTAEPGSPVQIQATIHESQLIWEFLR